MKLQLKTDELTTLANESAERNITMLKCKQRAEIHRREAYDTESAFPVNHTHLQSIPLITSAALSPNLLRKQYPLRNRAMKHQFERRNNQETNTAVSSGSEDADESPPILNVEERGRNS